MAMSKTVPTRAEVDPKDAWNLSKLFVSDEAWEKAFASYPSKAQALAGRKGGIAASSAALKAFLDDYAAFGIEEEALAYYAHLRADEDLGDNAASERRQRFLGASTTAQAALSWIRPELLACDPARMAAFIADPALKDYSVWLGKLYRFKPHSLSESEERLLALQEDANQTPSDSFELLTNVDLDYGSVDTPEGPVPLTQSSFGLLLRREEPEVRKEAYGKFYKAFDGHKHCLSALYAGSVKQDRYYAQVRNFPSARAAALFPDKVEEAVYEALVAGVRAALPKLHRYYELKRRALGLEKLSHWDVYASMVKEFSWSCPYDDAVGIVCDALEPLGPEYVRTLRSGLLGGWVDRYENKGKRSGAYSAGSFKGEPYILLNYKEGMLDSVFTMIHEGGHSMHSYYSARNNPYMSYGYTIFEAEVASTFNEQLLARHFTYGDYDKKLKLYVLAQEADDIVATFFRQTMFAEFEAWSHAHLEKGEALSLDAMRGFYRSLLEAYFGPEVALAPESDLECLRIPHFYRAFYVYKYATGIAASIALAERVLGGGARERDDYLGFLKSGGSRYPIESLRAAGVDMASPGPVAKTAERFGALLDELEAALKL
jgi:oligoendopeptidase F